ncbi:DOT1-domain-containing protein, partial [Acaromyces ingoldii]
VTLEYPAQGASETFSLLVPKDPDEYDPISDLLRTVAVIVGHYLTTEQKELFGSLDSLEVGSAAGNLLNRVHSILRSFTKARNRRDGPLFVRTVERFNAALRLLKESDKIKETVSSWAQRGISEAVWRWIQEQCYARTVGPKVEDLAKYEAFSDNVYGELLPRFMSEIAQLTSLGPNSVFVDLGSGVGNLVMQVALQTGAHAVGCEQMVSPSHLAKLQLEEARARWKVWGVKGGEMDAWQGDFGEDERIRGKLREADVVLVNNYAFTARTNDKLSLLFLDLKDGAQVVSLKPFVPPDFRLTERTLSSPLAILRVAQRAYSTNCVSWAESGGNYYIHTVDRTLVARFLEKR